MARNYFEETLAKWTSKIPEGDKLEYAKSEALEVAIGFRYPNEVLNKIILANSDVQIGKTLANARQSA